MIDDLGLTLCGLLSGCLVVGFLTLPLQKPPATTQLPKSLGQPGPRVNQLTKLETISSMPVNVEPRAKVPLVNKPLDEDAEEALKKVFWPIPHEYKLKVYYLGFGAFFDGFTIKDCAFSDRTPSYEVWRAGWVQAFRDYTKMKRTMVKDGEKGASCSC